MGKSRVRPLRSGISVPKLELTAATLLIKMNELIRRELNGHIGINRVTFWTDPAIVLRYILNENRRFVTFVANRVAVIREGSSPSQWRHVRSEDNPADYASRGLKVSETEKLEIRKRGPIFLWKDPDEWPQEPIELNIQLSDQDEGVKREKITVSASTIEENFWNVLFGRYSTWEKLRGLVAWLARALHAFQRLRATSRGLDNSPAILKQKTAQPSIQELEEAEKIIVRNVQHWTFPEEYYNLESSKGLLAKLKPFKKEGLL